MNLCDINDIKNLLREHHFQFSKGLGQNFLCEDSVPCDIALGANIDKAMNVLEVGPGIGTLTQQLCLHGKKVVAVELDKRLPELLAVTMAEFDNFTLVEGDILQTDLPALCALHFGDEPVAACANLPYYITTPVIAALIESKCFESITVMVQKEVAQRICAAPGKGDYGAFTVFINYHAHAKIILDVPKTCFIPSPKVDSAVVHLTLRKEAPPEIENQKAFFRVVKAAFAQRRKTLLNCLCQGFADKNKEQVFAWITSCGIDPTARGETLGLAEFAKLSNCLK